MIRAALIGVGALAIAVGVFGSDRVRKIALGLIAL